MSTVQVSDKATTSNGENRNKMYRQVKHELQPQSAHEYAVSIGKFAPPPDRCPWFNFSQAVMKSSMVQYPLVPKI